LSKASQERTQRNDCDLGKVVQSSDERSALSGGEGEAQRETITEGRDFARNGIREGKRGRAALKT